MKRSQNHRWVTASLMVSVLMASALLGAILPTQAAAASSLFWANSSTIGAANKDGTNVNQGLVSVNGRPLGVAANSSHLFWSNHDTGKIGRANLDGSNINQGFITGCSKPSGLAVDASYVYWTNYGNGTIGRAKLDGSNVIQAFISGGSGNDGVAVDEHYVYWANYAANTIGRAKLDGSNVNQAFIMGCSGPDGPAVDAGYVYWANYDASTIGRAKLDGSNADQSFIKGCSKPVAIAVDVGYVYWTNYFTNKIGRAKLDGSSVVQGFMSGCSSPYGIFVVRSLLSIRSFMADPFWGAPPLNVTFTCDALAKGGSIAEYHWDFDNNGVVDEVTALNTTQHTYAEGSHYAKVTVVDNLGGELSSKPGLIKVASGPDLTGRFSELHWYDTDNRVSLQFTVQNIGDQAAKSFYTYFYLSEDGNKLLLPPIKRAAVPGLAAGAATTISVDYSPTTTSIYGKYIVVKIDPAKAVPDIYTVNNSTKAAILVPKQKWP